MSRSCRRVAIATPRARGVTPRSPRLDSDGTCQFGARPHPEFAMDVAQVGLDRLGAHKELGRGLPAGRALRHHKRDLKLLSGELVAGDTAAGPFPGGGELPACPLGPGGGTEAVEGFEGRAQALARRGSPARAPQRSPEQSSVELARKAPGARRAGPVRDRTSRTLRRRLGRAARGSGPPQRGQAARRSGRPDATAWRGFAPRVRARRVGCRPRPGPAPRE
jgi:hypothetical protein